MDSVAHSLLSLLRALIQADPRPNSEMGYAWPPECGRSCAEFLRRNAVNQSRITRPEQMVQGFVVGVFGVLFTIVKERYNTGVRFLLVK
jgi:hypothetical protein